MLVSMEDPCQFILAELHDELLDRLAVAFHKVFVRKSSKGDEEVLHEYEGFDDGNLLEGELLIDTSADFKLEGIFLVKVESFTHSHIAFD